MEVVVLYVSDTSIFSLFIWIWIRPIAPRSGVQMLTFVLLLINLDSRLCLASIAQQMGKCHI